MTTPVTFRPADSKAVVGISRATLYRWAQAGHITLYRRGAMTFAKTAEVVEFITGDSADAGTTCSTRVQTSEKSSRLAR